MPAHRISTTKIQAIFGLLKEGEIKYRSTAKVLKMTRVTLKKYVSDIRSHQCQYPEKKEDIGFYIKILKGRLPKEDGYLRLQWCAEMVHTLSNSSTTRKVEWARYKASCPDGYGYSQFCTLFARWCKENNQVVIRAPKRLVTISEDDRIVFLKWKRSNNRTKWTQALVFLESSKGVSANAVARKLNISKKRIQKWLRLYEQSGLLGLERKARKINETDRNNIQEKKANLIKLIHEPPKLHGVNRAAWSLKTLVRAYFLTYGVAIGASTVSEYIRKEGYAFKKAKRVLTSPDPLYKEKLEKITSILANLASNEKFFSVDEFGPCAIKRKGGRALVKRNERNIYPQWQRSKGKLICTAALELATNQITHFFSEKKNTDEMIKLMEVLIEQYKSQKRIFISWDAASWHVSKNLDEKIREINHKQYRKQHGTPLVELAPLPASAQFLNVIESVFSGMAKAIIHNSNYSSVAECQMAINRYFVERNAYFQENPKKAGNKIWGKELALPVFHEAGIFKDSRWR